MTESETKKTIQAMLVAFPDLEECAKWNSPDLPATHREWGKVLNACEYEECMMILDRWHDRGGPDRADVKRPAHAMRAEVMRARDVAAKRRESQARVQEYQQLPNTPYTDATMSAAYAELLPHFTAYRLGEISEDEYQEKKRQVLNAM